MTRNDYFQIIGELIEAYHDNPVVLSELLDIELSLIRHCSESCIERFHDEPVNQEALVSYVRDLMWKS